MSNTYVDLKKRTWPTVRLAVVALAVVGIVSLWHKLPAAEVEAAAPVDQKIVAPAGTPASFADIIEAVSPAVVNISTSATLARSSGPLPEMPFPPDSPFEDFLRRFFERQSLPGPEGTSPMVQGQGSGFIFEPDGYVVTNHHVIDGAEEIQVVLNDGKRYDATLVGSDPKTDLALLKIEPEGPLPYARFGDSDSARIGDWIVAIGNPFGLGGTATTGIISARGRDIQSGPFDDFLQIDAPINRGNSGGPLFDTSGKVIGINTAIYSPNGGSVGIGFAIPAKQAQPVIEQLKATGHVVRGWLGVQIQTIDDDIANTLNLKGTQGALVAQVVPNSPAEKAGIRAGDVLLGFNGSQLDNIKDLTRRVAEVHPGDSVSLDVWRQGRRETLKVVLGESPAVAASNADDRRGSGPAPPGHLGLRLAELTPAARQQFDVGDDIKGALVVGVEPGSTAAQKGLRSGDVLVMVGQTPVSGPKEASQAIERASAEGHSRVLLQIARGESRHFVAVPFA